MNMPDRIIESSIRTFRGGSLVWDRTSSAGDRLTIKSKESSSVRDNVLVVATLFAIGGLKVRSF